MATHWESPRGVTYWRSVKAFDFPVGIYDATSSSSPSHFVLNFTTLIHSTSGSSLPHSCGVEERTPNSEANRPGFKGLLCPLTLKLSAWCLRDDLLPLLQPVKMKWLIWRHWVQDHHSTYSAPDVVFKNSVFIWHRYTRTVSPLSAGNGLLLHLKALNSERHRGSSKFLWSPYCELKNAHQKPRSPQGKCVALQVCLPRG